MTRDEKLHCADAVIDSTAGAEFPCSGFAGDYPVEGHASCLHRLGDKIRYHDQLPPKVYARLCGACRAHWHALMCRNAISDAVRWQDCVEADEHAKKVGA